MSLSPTLTVSHVELMFIGVGRHDLVKMTEAVTVPVDGGSGVHLHPILHVFEAEDDGGDSGVVGDNVGVDLHREIRRGKPP